MMSNERQRQASINLVVAKYNLENRQKEKQRKPLQNKQIKITNTYLKRLRVRVDHATRTYYLEFSPNGQMKKSN